MTTQKPFIPELPPNPDKIQKLFALRELLQKVAGLKDDKGCIVFDYGDSHIRHAQFDKHPVINILDQENAEALASCGTPGCVAGWCGLLDPVHTVCDTNYWDSNKAHATDFLELTNNEADFLFLCEGYYSDEGELLYLPWHDQDYGPTLAYVPIEEAIKRLDFLIAQNE